MSQQSKPYTLKELRNMDGTRVWMEIYDPPSFLMERPLAAGQQ